MSEFSQIVLGKSGEADAFLDVNELISTRLLIQGNSGAGKSWVIRRICEQLFGKIPVIIIDPEGDFASLREKCDYVLVGQNGETPAQIDTAQMVAHRLLDLRASAVCDIYELKPKERHEWVRLFLEAIIDAPKSLWRPTIIVVDESHIFSPERGQGESEASEAMKDLATRGRKRGFCLPPGELIITEEGLKKIEDIRTGDKVLTHVGRFRKVIATSKRAYQGKLIKVRSFNNYLSTTTTPEHPFNVHLTHNNGAGTKVISESAWISPTKLNVGENKNATRTFSPVVLVEKDIEDITVEFEPRNRAPITRKGIQRHKTKCSKLPLNENAMRVIGWYLAEGSIGWRQYQVGKYPSKVIFSLGSHEEDKVRVLRNDLRKLGFRSHIVRWETSLRVGVASRGLAELMSRFFGCGSENKNIPFWFHKLPKNKLSELLGAYLKGDGWIKKRKPFEARASTVSFSLAFSMRLIGEKVGYFSRIARPHYKAASVIRGRTITSRHATYQMNFCENPRSSKRVCGRPCFSIAEKTQSDYEGLVYNLEVDEDNSFCTAAHVVHNCGIYATQRIAMLSKTVTAQMLNRLVGMTFEDIDLDRAADLLSIPRSERLEFNAQMKVIDPGYFYGLGRAISKERILIRIGPVKTSHPKPGAANYGAAPPPAPEKVRALISRLSDIPQVVAERAHTETELRMEIKNLRDRLSQADRKVAAEPGIVIKEGPTRIETKIKIKEIKIPLVKDRQIKRLEKTLDQTEKLVERAEKLSERTMALGKPLVESASKLRSSIASLMSIDSEKILQAETEKFEADQKEEEKVEKTQVAVAAKNEAAPGAPADVELTNPRLTILRALRELMHIDIDVPSREQLAGWLGIKTSGSFRNNLGALRTGGYINYEGDGVLINKEGLRVAPPPAVEVTHKAIFEHVLRAVTGPQAEILKIVHAKHPEWLSREDLAVALGIAVTGSFRNNLGRLHTAKMLDYGSGEKKNCVKCADWMFVGGVVPSV